jgi:hypothetical protein
MTTLPRPRYISALAKFPGYDTPLETTVENYPTLTEETPNERKMGKISHIAKQDYEDALQRLAGNSQAVVLEWKRMLSAVVDGHKILKSNQDPKNGEYPGEHRRGRSRTEASKHNDELSERKQKVKRKEVGVKEVGTPSRNNQLPNKRGKNADDPPSQESPRSIQKLPYYIPPDLLLNAKSYVIMICQKVGHPDLLVETDQLTWPGYNRVVSSRWEYSALQRCLMYKRGDSKGSANNYVYKARKALQSPSVRRSKTDQVGHIFPDEWGMSNDQKTFL